MDLVHDDKMKDAGKGAIFCNVKCFVAACKRLTERIKMGTFP